MVDYSSALPQLQMYQAPNMLALAQQGQQMQMGNILMQEKQRGFAESNALRDLIAKGVDPTTPAGQRALIAAAPNSGPALVKTYLEMAGQQRQNQTAEAELSVKNIGFHRNLLPSVTDQTAYSVWRSNTIKDLPKLEASIPKEYSPDTVRNLMTTADKMVDEYNQRTRPTVHTFGDTPYSVTGTTAQPITMGGAAPNAGPVDLASDMLRKYEGFRETPYYDVNAYRSGYGSDTITKSDGSITKVAPGARVTREDAERDLSRRLTTEFIPRATSQVGAERWSALPARAQAALASVTYNYGSLPNSVVNAIKTGDINAIADAVQALKDNPGRRAQEAADIRNSGQMQPGGQNSLAAMTGTFAAPANMLAAPQQTPLSLNPSIAGVAPGTPINAAKVPENYRRNAQGNLEFIPGSPADPAVVQAKQEATTMGAKTAEARVKALASIPQVIDNAKILEDGIAGLIGKSTIDERGNVKYNKKALPHPGFEAAVGASLAKALPQWAVPYEGTDRAGFDERFKQVTSGAFMDAYNTLRGGGAITEKEGEKGTAALNRMSLKTSEKEFIEAANDFLGVVRRGVERAKEMSGKTGVAPQAQAAGFTVTTPDNKVHTFPSQEAMDNFKRAAGL